MRQEFAKKSLLTNPTPVPDVCINRLLELKIVDIRRVLAELNLLFQILEKPHEKRRNPLLLSADVPELKQPTC